MYERKASLFVPLIGFFSMSLGGIMMPLVGIAGDHTAMPMAILMVTGYGSWRRSVLYACGERVGSSTIRFDEIR